MEWLHQLVELPILGGVLFAVAGAIQYFFPPKNINSLYGYRTGTSMQSQKHWDEAQKISAKKLIVSGLIIIVLGLALNSFAFSDKIRLFSSIGLVLLTVFYVLFTTEQDLKKIK
ncbi:SdpI family protein [Flavobacterium sp.]|uniref:SdpI family protein n=1 Tax=Flavobacterium sp. TaxID=239 RepID=UPI0028BDF143|nr:SdpI family protein [Flavobacterium sp.]